MSLRVECELGRHDGDEFHAAAALVALEDVDGEYATEAFCPWQGSVARWGN